MKSFPRSYLSNFSDTEQIRRRATGRQQLVRDRRRRAEAEAEANDVAWARPWPSIRLFVRPYLARIVKQAKARKKQFSP